MLVDHLFGQSEKRAGLSIDFLMLLRAASENGEPIPLSGRPIRPLAVFGAPTLRVDVLSAPKERSEQRDFGGIIGKGCQLCDVGGCWKAPNAGRLRWFPFRERYGVLRENRLQLADFLAQQLSLCNCLF